MNMSSTMPLIMQAFDRQFEEGKAVFGALTKKIKSKKAIELERNISFFKLHLYLLEKIHFKDKNLVYNTFMGFKTLHKSLKKVHHIRLISDGFQWHFGDSKISFSAYEKKIAADKKSIYTQVYEIILSTPLQVWEDLYHNVYDYSKNLSALTINTASTQIINEEIEFFHFDTKNRLDPLAIHDIFTGLNKITALEKIRLKIGLNTVFTHKVHQQMNELTQVMENWHKNHLIYQHLSHFLRDNEKIDKKYHFILSQIKQSHKLMTKEVELKCTHLFKDMLH